MGIIKTAMMSGAAMYGMNKLAQSAQARGNNSSNYPPPSRGYPDREDAYYSRPVGNQEGRAEGGYPAARAPRDRPYPIEYHAAEDYYSPGRGPVDRSHPYWQDARDEKQSRRLNEEGPSYDQPQYMQSQQAMNVVGEAIAKGKGKAGLLMKSLLGN